MSCRSCEEKRRQYNILHAIRDVVTGEAEYVTPEVQNQRLSICHACPGGFYDKELKLCRVCKCFVKAKTKFKESSCPKDFWKEE